ncbi:MAG: B12-binding domain-containing radical SAM protein [Candidatus Omnitrophica bacterium]|nr:B12-binding domain-containing radical SAM protein [Candidatus Omnitrophota bacterium]
MQKIILVNTPPWGTAMPPLGVAYLATYLKSKGIDIDTFDLNLELFLNSGDKEKVFWGLDAINKIPVQTIANNIFSSFMPYLEKFFSFTAKYDLIGFSANNLISTTFAGILAEHIRKRYPEKIIILGGPGCFHSWDRSVVPQGSVDFFVIGEGEETLHQLICVLRSGIDKNGGSEPIPGVIDNRTGKKQRFIPRREIRDINSIPHPTFEEFSFTKYESFPGYHPLPMLMSRGCINECSFCIDCYMSSPFRMRAAGNIVEEIKYHKNRYGITHVEFNDLLCNGNIYQLEQFCDLMIRESLDIRWISYAAVRKNMSEDLLKKMRQAGCTSLCYGLESGSDNVLKKMNKHYGASDAAELIKKTAAAGIEVRINIIVGFPGETERDFAQTLTFIRENKDYIRQVTNVSSFVLMPSAQLAITPHRYGISYLDSDDLGKWTDDNRLTQDERNNRVKKTCRLLAELQIDNLIINLQEPVCKDGDRGVLHAAGEKNNIREETKENICAKAVFKEKKYRRENKLFKFLVLAGLLLFSVIADLYLFIIKKIRGSIIFPGS